jgi:transcriptional regulator with GAF, ATPase, and Fis domain
MIEQQNNIVINNSGRFLEEKLEFEKLISGFSSKFISLPWNQIDEAIDNSLKQLVEFLKFERGTLLEVSSSGDDLLVTHQYAQTGIRRTSGSYSNKEIVPWFHSQLMSGKTLILSKLDDLPLEAEKERELASKINFKSSITIPFSVGGKIAGALGFNTESFDIEWHDELVNRLKFIADIFATAISRKNNESKLERLQEKLKAENILLKKDIDRDYSFENIIGQSDTIKYVLYRIQQVAPTNTTVLIEGETGVGKQLFAYAIHSLSKRSDHPMFKMNCAALSPTLIESELFGHEKGAFTGADKTVKGRFEIADGGTLFLDEIGELPMNLQAKLLRVLQDGEFERLGSTQSKKVDVRIIAATNKVLKKEIEEGKFRKDLYYRLSAYPITIPPVRERKEDIPLLISHYVEKFSREMGKTIETVSKKTIEKLVNYSWPGNVRELENVIERAVVISQGNSLNIIEDFHKEPVECESICTLDENEKVHIVKILEKTNGRIEGKSGAAELLGINPSTLRSRIKKLGITSKQVIS